MSPDQTIACPVVWILVRERHALVVVDARDGRRERERDAVERVVVVVRTITRQASPVPEPVLRRSRSRGGVSVDRHCASNVAITASAITRSGRPETWLALRSRANASASERLSFSISRPFARSIALRATSASASESASARTSSSSVEPRARGLDRGDDVLLAKRLDEVAEDADLDRARDELVLAERRQHHDRDRPLLEDPPRGLDPVEPRHLDVHHREVRLELARKADGLLAVARLAHDLVPGPLEQPAQVEADDRLVLGDQDPHRVEC